MNKKEHQLKLIFNVLKVAFRSSKIYCWSAIFMSFTMALISLVGILSSYFILYALESGKDFSYVLNIIIIVIVSEGIIILGNWAAKFINEKYNPQIEDGTEYLVAQKAMELDYSQTELQETLNLIRLAEDGVNSHGGLGYFVTLFADLFFKYLFNIVYSVVTIASLFGFSKIDKTNTTTYYLSSCISLITIFLAIIIGMVITIFVEKKCNKLNYDFFNMNVDVNRKCGYFFDICSNYKYGKDLRIFGLNKTVTSMQKNMLDNLNQGYIDISVKIYNYHVLTIVYSGILLLFTYVVVGAKAIYGYIGIGSLVSTVSAITLISTSLNNFVKQIGNLNLMSDYLDNYFKFLNLQPEIKEGKEILDINKPVSIEFKDVTFSYPCSNIKSLDGISFRIESGKKLAFVGSNGAGKSTIIKLLCCLYKPDSGQILINDKDLYSYTRKSVMDYLGIVFQDFKIFSTTVKENILLGQEFDKNKFDESLMKAGIYDRVQKMDKKEETLLYQLGEENGVEISGGEAQKLAIARAVYKDSPLIILDEPTAALDPKSEAEIYERINEMIQGKTSIFISHRMSACRFVDSIMVIDGGKVKETGSHNDLLKLNGLYKKMWDSQAKYYQ